MLKIISRLQGNVRHLEERVGPAARSRRGLGNTTKWLDSSVNNVGEPGFRGAFYLLQVTNNQILQWIAISLWYLVEYKSMIDQDRWAETLRKLY